MAQLKGTYFKIYLDNEHIAYLRSNDFNSSTNMIDITSKESLGDKEQLPGLREFTASCEGWVEQVRINKLRHSQGFNASDWEKVGSTIINSNQTAPDGSNTAWTINFDVDGDVMRQTVTESILNDSVYIASVWLRAASPCTVSLIVRSDDESQGTTLVCNVTTTWQRFSVAYTFIGSEDGVEFVLVRNAGNTVTDLVIWGAQLEVGSASRTLPSAYQPTPRQISADIYNEMQNEQSYTARVTTNITGEETYTGTAYISNINHTFANEEAAAFTCDLAFSGAVTT